MIQYKYLPLVPTLFYFFLLFGCQQQPAKQSEKVIPFSNIDVTTAKMIHASEKQVIFLDVRTPEETAEGGIPRAISLDFRAGDFATQLEGLDKEEPYVVYCRSGGRSAKASQMMSDKGFVNVKNMEGGYLAWTE